MFPREKKNDSTGKEEGADVAVPEVVEQPKGKRVSKNTK